MNTLNLTAAKPTSGHPSLRPLLNHNRPYFGKPLSSISFRFPPPPLPRFSLTPIKASSGNSSLEEPLEPLKFQNPNQNTNISSISFSSTLKTTLVTTITAAALVFYGFCFSIRPSIATPVSPPPDTVETAEENSIMEEGKEKLLEGHLLSNPNDIDALKELMDIKVSGQKVAEAIDILDRLIDIQSEQPTWLMMRAHLRACSGDLELARNEFNKLVERYPLRVEIYHGLVTVASQEESGEGLVDVERRIEEAMKLCEKKNETAELRAFRLLVAQIRVLEGKYDEALKMYERLVKEEPRDFRPYLCQGIIYTLLNKHSEAEKNFDKYRRLVPKNHPYTSYFDDNMLATKIFAEKMEKERAMAKS